MTTQPANLVSLALSLRPAGPPASQAVLPLWWGRAAHALLLQVMRQSDEDLAQDLHESGSSPRPFTTSTLIGYDSRRGLQAERVYTLRLTGLNQEVSGRLLEASQAGGSLHPGREVELDFLPFEIVANSLCLPAAAGDGAQAQAAARWSRQTSYQELSAPYLLAKAPPERRLTLKFFSPASWKAAAGMHIPMPLPELFFSSLLNRWNAFAPVTLPAEVRRYAAECLAISRYRLSSSVIPQKQGSKRIGCVGEVTYSSLNYDPYWMGLLQALADYAFFAGVGISTTQGMGQCCRVEAPAKKHHKRVQD